MLKRSVTCESWFVNGPPDTTAKPSEAAAVRIQQLPDKPARPKTMPNPPADLPPVAIRKTEPTRRPRLVNWPVVAGIGAVVWFWLVGAILVGWLASSPAASEAVAVPVVVAVPAQPEKIIPATPAVVLASIKPADVVPVAPPKPAPQGDPVGQTKPELQPVAVPVPVVEKPAPVKEEIGKYGTTIDFIDDPIEAADKAMKNRKILFVLHVSGDFEDPGCT